MSAANQRRNYFVNKEVQVRFAAVLVFISLLTSIQLIAYVTFFDSDMISRAGKFGLTQNDVAVSFMIVEHKAMLVKLVLYLCVNMVLVGLFGLFFSHRLTGPIYRVEKFLKKVAEGDLSGTVRLRKSDQFQSFAESVNLMLECLRQKRRDELESLRQLHKQVASKGSNPDEALRLIDIMCRQCEADLFSGKPIDDKTPAASAPSPLLK